MKKLIAFYKRHNNLIFFGVLAVILLVPQIRVPVQVFVNRIFSFSPSEITAEKRISITDWNWFLSDEKQQLFSFSTVKGKVVLINYWATWCPPCIAEFPDLQALHDAFEEKDIVFLFIAQDEPEKVRKFMEKKGYTVPIYYLQSAPPAVLNSNALPTTYLINKSGEIVMQKTGAANWNSSSVHATIEKLFIE